MLFAALVFLIFGPECVKAQTEFTVEERIAMQEAVERVYYERRKDYAMNELGALSYPAFEDTISAAEMERKVQDTLLWNKALETVFGQPALVDADFEAEMTRMADHTNDPRGLNALIDALDASADKVTEGLLRPVLVSTRIQKFFATDPVIHGEARARIEAIREAVLNGASMKVVGGEFYRCRVYHLLPEEAPDSLVDEEGRREGPCTARRMRASSFAAATANLPAQRTVTAVSETRDFLMFTRTAVKSPAMVKVEEVRVPKISFDEWWAETRPSVIGNPIPFPQPPPGSTPIKRPLPCRIPEVWTWKPLGDAAGIVTGRYRQTAVWTGAEMIVWGGENPEEGHLDSGGRYVPATEAWMPTSLTDAPSPRSFHTAVWTGTEMIVWGGARDLDPDCGCDVSRTGGRYNPAADSWTPTSTVNAPAARNSHTAVWTGSEMVVWGGWDHADTYFNTGGKYDPAADAWVETDTFNPPCARTNHRAVWAPEVGPTGSMILWGGFGSVIDPFTKTCSSSLPKDFLNTGGQYDPNPFAPQPWRDISTINAPTGRLRHTAVWTGAEMIVWGGRQMWDGIAFRDGGRFNPFMGKAGTWTPTSLTDAPEERYWHSSVWTGLEMIVWGGTLNALDRALGGHYFPSTDAWAPTAAANAPVPRSEHTAVWTGGGLSGRMFVWGGLSGGIQVFLDNGGAYFLDCP